jgi:ribosomal protein L7/L12
MHILAQSAGYEAGRNLGAGLAGIVIGLLLLMIPAFVLKFSAKILEKTDVTFGNAYGVAFVMSFVWGCITIGVRIWATVVGEEYAREIVSQYGWLILSVLLLSAFVIDVWLVAASFEISYVGGLKVVLAPLLMVFLPFTLLLGPAIYQRAMNSTTEPNVAQGFPQQPGIPPAMPPRLNIPIQPPPAQSSPPRSLNLNLPDKAENSPLPTSPQSKESAATPPRALFKTPTSRRRKDNYPITIPIPTGFTRLTSSVPVKPGFRLKACWGRQWHDVTVKEVNKDDSLFIHWEKFGDGFDGDLPRNQLIISQSILKGIKAFSEDEAKTENSNTPESAETSEKPEAAEQKESSSNESSTPSADDNEEKQAAKFKVVITSVGKQSVQVAKAFGKLNELTLADSLEFIENVPLTLKRNLSREAADKLAREFKALGATVTVEQQ